jgi:hypothetical protein
MLNISDLTRATFTLGVQVYISGRHFSETLEARIQFKIRSDNRIDITLARSGRVTSHRKARMTRAAILMGLMMLKMIKSGEMNKSS